ncbi:MAG: NAD(P)/FAD-dependent oxidoreductase [Opitutaceae bacterium]|nr:NAD(P)/FAD-dependent oxidoreductase [Opitutaceae bacterium]
MPTETHYDVAIIGAGMSALAAGIRLAHFGKKVCLFERHNVVGGLNSFYSAGGRKFDVGLHAMTNFVPREVRGTPLGKILRQLRLDRDALDLCPQLGSAVRFPGVELAFTNDFAVLESEVARAFPTQIDGFCRFVAEVRAFDDTVTEPPAFTARAMLRRHLTDPVLEDMLLCPLCYYGSATPHDMDALQFVIMFKSIFFEGFARPFEGVRVLLRLLTERLRECGGERRMKCGVRRLRTGTGRVTALELDNGETVTADWVLSSAGAAETLGLCAEPVAAPASAVVPTEDAAGGGAARSTCDRLAFVETIQVIDRQPRDLGWGETIVFFNDSERFDYGRPAGQVDGRSGVICLPNNFDFGGRVMPEGCVRVTCQANFEAWAALPEPEYRAAKARWFGAMTTSARRFLAPLAPGSAEPATLATDVFTPLTVTRYTGHFGGAIYGAPRKHRDGRTPYANLVLIGTDQGFLGITGAMLSGIAMANQHVLAAK